MLMLMSAVVTGQMPAVETGQVSAVETRQMFSAETSQIFKLEKPTSLDQGRPKQKYGLGQGLPASPWPGP